MSALSWMILLSTTAFLWFSWRRGILLNGIGWRARLCHGPLLLFMTAEAARYIPHRLPEHRGGGALCWLTQLPPEPANATRRNVHFMTTPGPSTAPRRVPNPVVLLGQSVRIPDCHEL